jgi:hypothetical protein
MAGPRLTTLVPRVRRLPARLRRLPVSIGYFRGPKLMSWLRKRWVRFRNPHADIRFGRGTYLGPGFSLDMPFGGTFVTGEYAEFRRNFRAEFGARETASSSARALAAPTTSCCSARPASPSASAAGSRMGRPSSTETTAFGTSIGP